MLIGRYSSQIGNSSVVTTNGLQCRVCYVAPWRTDSACPKGEELVKEETPRTLNLETRGRLCIYYY
jgi:hypothetical protein